VFITAKPFIKKPCGYASPGSQDCTARRFLFRNPKTTQNNMSRLTALNARQAVYGKFPETQNFKRDRNNS